MNEKYAELYSDLLVDLGRIGDDGAAESARTESCFGCCTAYWENVKGMVVADGFASEEEEVRFFKYIKARFTGQLEFYTHVYRFLAFCPHDDPWERDYFIQNELKKLKWFRDLQTDLIIYLANGDRSMDQAYFLRRNYRTDDSHIVRIYDPDGVITTSKDPILTQLAGYGLYGEWLRERTGDEQ